MLVILSIVIFLFLGIVLIFLPQKFMRWSRGVDDFADILGTVITVVAALALIMALISIPIERMGTYSGIHKFTATKITVRQARKGKKSIKLENVRLQKDIIEQNKWLASKKYYNDTVFDLWIPDKIENIELIENVDSH